MSTTREVVRSFWESYNEHDLDNSWEQYLSHDLKNHAFEGAYDREAWLGIEKGFIAAFPDVHLEILGQVTEGDLSATRVAMTGTQKEEFYGVPAAGAVGTLRVTFFDRVADGKITEHWADADVGGFLQQLSSSAPVALA
jgi:predicted ester cyclase